MPIHLIEAGIVTSQRAAHVAEAPTLLAPAFVDRLQPAKHVRIPFIPRDRWLTAARESCRTLAEAVTASLRAGAFPVVLGGECTLVAGTVSGALAHDPELHLIYLDAHADFHTLATTQTHEISSMCLAHLCSRPAAALLWPGAKRIADDRVMLVGGRVMDAGEAGNLARTRVARVAFDADHAEARGVLTATRHKAVWVHLDLDLIDPADWGAVVQPEPGGPPIGAVAELLRGLAAIGTVRGIEVCGYDPSKDPGKPKLAGVLANLIAEICPALSGGRAPSPSSRSSSR